MLWGTALHSQTRFWFKKQGNDSLLQIAYFGSSYEHDESFNQFYWEEGGRARFDFPHGTRQFKTGLVKGWLTHREFFFADEKGNPRVDSVLWAEGQMQDFKRIGIWKKYHRNGQVSLQREFCDGAPCGTIFLYHETGAIKACGPIDEREFPHGLWKGEFPDGKPRFEIQYEHGVTKGRSKHYTQEGLYSEVHFVDAAFASRYDTLKLYYPETGRKKALIVRSKQRDKILEAWDEDGNQTVFAGAGSISGNFPFFREGYVETVLVDGRVLGEERRYFDKERKILQARTIRSKQDSSLYYRSLFFKDGTLESEYSFRWEKAGEEYALIFQGMSRHYYGNGKLASQANFHNGRLVGVYQKWSPSGVLMKELAFSTDSQSVSGPTQRIDEEPIYGEGIPNGTWKFWSETGVLIKEENYKNGLRDGLWKTWHLNGRLASERAYKGDKAEGKGRYFDEEGRKLKAPRADCPDQNWGSGFLCDQHKDVITTDDIGHCGRCGQGTSSGMFSLCAKCACETGKCQLCGRDL